MRSMRWISSGATMLQRGPPMLLLFAISGERSTPSAKTRLRALEPTPEVRVLIVAWVSPGWRFRTSTLGRYFTASSVLVTFTESRISLAVMPSALAGTAFLAAKGGASSTTIPSAGGWAWADADAQYASAMLAANRCMVAP